MWFSLGERCVTAGSRIVASLALPLVVSGTSLLAESLGGKTPSDLQRLVAAGDYVKALVTFEQMPQRTLTTDARVSAARSAWALGLPDEALSEFDRVLRDNSLDALARARVLVSKSTIQLQEGRHLVASVLAEEAVKLLDSAAPPGGEPVHANALALWAESLSRLGQHAQAANKFEAALDLAQTEQAPEFRFLAGETNLTLGRDADARAQFEQIPLQHERAPEALRHLAELALRERDGARALLWLRRARAEFPDQFLDGWVDYALLQAAALVQDAQSVRAIREEVRQRYAPSDQWRILVEAAAEEIEWRAQKPEQQTTFAATLVVQAPPVPKASTTESKMGNEMNVGGGKK